MNETLYKSDYATVILGDARDVLADLETESVDLVVADPPYGVEWRSGLREERFSLLTGDAPEDRDGIREVLSESVRAVGQNRHLYIFGPADVVQGLKVAQPVELIWDKQQNGAGDLASAWAPAHERVTFTVSKHRHGGETGGATVPARLRKGSVLRCKRPNGRKVRHPTEKPVALLAELVESSSRAGETVLDPFAGIGSTAVAAILRGRRAISIEIDENYARLAVDRIRRAERLADAMHDL